MEIISRFNSAQLKKSPQNWKDPKEEISALRLTWELFVLAKDSAPPPCQLWQCQNSSVFFLQLCNPQDCAWHTNSPQLPSHIREISLSFPHPQPQVIGWECRSKGWEGRPGIPSAIVNFTFFECNRPLVQMGCTEHGEILNPSAPHKTLQPCHLLGLGAWNNPHLNQVDY